MSHKGIGLALPKLSSSGVFPDPYPIVDQPAAQQTGLHWRNIFTAFKYPNYRLWFGGQLASLTGTWMQITAQGYLIYELTHSAQYLGYAGFASGLPTWLLMLFGGVISDRISRRKLLIIVQSYLMVLALVLAFLCFAGIVRPAHIIILSFFVGIGMAFEAPARQAFVMEMVDREDLSNAIALNSTMFNLAIVVGPAVSGIIYAMFGPAWCFTLNGLSFLGVISALALMKLKPYSRKINSHSALADLLEGFQYISNHSIIKTLIFIAGMTSLFGMTFATLLPAWAVNILHGDARTNGFLQSARGVGALGGAILIAALGRFKFKGRLMSMGTLFFPVFLMIWVTLRWLPISLISLVTIGLAFIIIFNLLNALIQERVSDDLRGRVMGVYSLTFFGFMPICALLAGIAAETIGEPLTILVSALICLLFALIIWQKMPQIRQLQ
ncbi:MFS transporter [bacterium]|nr:MFS transporter [bacterium]